MSSGGTAEKQDQLEANKALIRRTYDEWWNANGNVESVDEMVSPNFVGHLGGGETRDIKKLRNEIRMYQSAFGGLREVVDDLIAEGNKVVGRYTMFGTHTGEFHGVRPTGKKLKVSGIEIYRIEEGKIIEFWHFGERIDFS